jgi:CSLREA domain-containing protein
MRQVLSHLSYRPRWGVSAGLLMVVLFALSLSARASAGTISVTTTFDQLDGSAPCSLREAVDTANADANSGGCTDANPAAADTIKLAGGDYNLQRAGVEDANASGDLDVTESLTIAGDGADVSGIDGNGALTGDRVLQISSGTLTISGLTVHDGSSNTGGGIGGSDFGATLRLIDSTVSGNEVGGGGGGIRVGVVTLTDSTVSGNTAGTGGGGICCETVTLTRSIVSGNETVGQATRKAAGSSAAPSSSRTAP